MSKYCQDIECSCHRHGVDCPKPQEPLPWEEAVELLRYFVGQVGFPFGDFAEIAGVDLKEVAEKFQRAKEILSRFPERGGEK